MSNALARAGTQFATADILQGTGVSITSVRLKMLDSFYMDAQFQWQQ